MKHYASVTIIRNWISNSQFVYIRSGGAYVGPAVTYALKCNASWIIFTTRRSGDHCDPTPISSTHSIQPPAWTNASIRNQWGVHVLQLPIPAMNIIDFGPDFEWSWRLADETRIHFIAKIVIQFNIRNVWKSRYIRVWTYGDGNRRRYEGMNCC